MEYTSITFFINLSSGAIESSIKAAYCISNTCSAMCTEYCIYQTVIIRHKKKRCFNY